MVKLAQWCEPDDSAELEGDVHMCWNSLRDAIDRRLLVALDDEAPWAERRRAAAWLAVVCRMAVTLDDDPSADPRAR